MPLPDGTEAPSVADTLDTLGLARFTPVDGAKQRMTDAHTVEIFLRELEETLQSLQEIQGQRLTALRSMDTDVLEELASSEGECADRARRALSCQTDSDDDGFSRGIGTLRRMLEDLPEAQRDQFRDRLARLRDHAAAVRDILAANWLVTYRMNQHVQGMLEILSCDDSDFGESDEGTGLYLDHRA